MDVLVLEARDRVGGRVHSYQGPGFRAKVDLGASLVTGTAPNISDALPPDPSSFIIKQLRIKLHRLNGQDLPIYSGTDGRLLKDLDEKVDALRDKLLDVAGERVEEEGEAKVVKESLGAALEKALEEYQAKAAAAAAAAAAGAAGVKEGAEAAAAVAAEDSAAGGAEGGLKEVKDEVKKEEAAAAAAGKGDVGGKEGGEEKQEEGVKDEKMEDAGDSKEAGAAGGGAAEEVSGDSEGPPEVPTAEMLQLLNWHWANLEYGCSAPLAEVSLPYWNQDEEWGGFGGPHAMVVGGYDQVVKGLAEGVTVKTSTPVVSIDYSQGDEGVVVVTTGDGEKLEAKVVIVTLPLGVLKAKGVTFTPDLPPWKQAAVERLGFGDLNKVVLQFERVFWEDLDFFGVAQPGGVESRGRCFMFWNLARFSEGVPLLTCLVSGRAARAAEEASDEEMKGHAMQVGGWNTLG